MQLLIDGDIVAYRCAASMEPSKKAAPRELTQEETNFEREIAIARCDTLMRELIHTTQADTYQCFISGGGNFRYKVYPEYKANRKDTVDPRFRADCKEFLLKEWNSTVSQGCEADDLLGINQMALYYSDVYDVAEGKHKKNSFETIIATIDKDLLMIPGWHYNWVRDEKTYTAPLDGIKYCYKQMLIGDKADNIIGVAGLGPVKAGKLIDNLETELEMINVVLDLYNDDTERFVRNIMCLWIMQREEETWAHRVDHSVLPSQLRLEVAAVLESTKYSMGDILMEPIMIPPMTSGILVNGEWTESMEAVSLPLI